MTALVDMMTATTTRHDTTMTASGNATATTIARAVRMETGIVNGTPTGTVTSTVIDHTRATASVTTTALALHPLLESLLRHRRLLLLPLRLALHHLHLQLLRKSQ